MDDASIAAVMVIGIVCFHQSDDIACSLYLTTRSADGAH